MENYTRNQYQNKCEEANPHTEKQAMQAAIKTALEGTSALQDPRAMAREVSIKVTRCDSLLSASSSEDSYIGPRTRGRSGVTPASGTAAIRSRSPSRIRRTRNKEPSECSSFDPDPELDLSSTYTERAELPSFREINRKIDAAIERQGGIPLAAELLQPAEELQQSGDQEEEDGIPVIKEKRGRGCPETTGDFKRKQTEQARKEERTLQREKKTLGPLIKPSLMKSYKDFIGSISDKEEEYRQAPIADLEALVSEKCTDIYKVAVNSGNLKGSFTKAVKEAAADVCAAATVLAVKAQNPQETGVEEEMKKMRHEMHLLRMENVELRKTIEKLKRTGNRKETQRPAEEPRETSLTREKGRRTERWVKESSPLPGDGEPSGIGTIPMSESPLPPPDRKPPKSKEKRTRGEAHPPEDGASPEVHEEGKMEWRSEIFGKEEFPPLGRRKTGNRPGPSALPLQKGRIVDIVEEDKEGCKEKHKQEALIAMMEGICERIMDQRMGNPVPSFAQRKEAERAKTKTEKRGGGGKTNPPAPQKGQTRSTRANNNTPLATTLNPPARPGLPRVKAIEKVSIKIPLHKKAEEKKGKGNASASTSNPQKKTTPQETQQPTETWTTVVSRKAAKKGRDKEMKGIPQKQQQPRPAAAAPQGKKTVPPKKKRREPKMAAVTVTCPPGEYEAIMSEARQKMEGLESLGIRNGVKIRRAMTGALVYEIPGEGSNELADKLALRLRQVLSGKEGVKVQRPTKTAELRLRGLDETVTPSEVREAVSGSGGCEEEEVSVGEIRRAPNGTKMARVRCPLRSANAIAKKAHIQIGWAMVRAELLDNRPLQCYKCLEGGHVRARCPNKADRSGKCYRCGEEGHRASTCEAPVRCAVCTDKNLPANHRTGGKSCTPVQKGRRGIPLTKIAGTPKRPGTTPMEVEPLRKASPPKERPLEQRPPRAKGGRRYAEEGENPPSGSQGAGKRQRLKENLEGGNNNAMDVAEGGTTKMIDVGQ